MGQVRPWFQWRALVTAGVLVVVAGTAALVAGLVHEPVHPVLGWLPLPFGALLAAHACWRTARSASLDHGTRRFWRHLSIGSVLYGVAIVANTADAVGGPVPSQRIGPVTLVCYLLVLIMIIWSLLRLPSWQRTSADWIRFGLDAFVVLVACGAFVWHFSMREHARWAEQTGSSASVFAIVLVGFVSVITFVKVAFAGAGRLDRRSLLILAIGSATATACGALTPFLTAYPWVSSSLIAVPIGTLAIQLAAIQQQAGGDRPELPRRTGKISVVPYIAVAAMAALLLATGSDNPGEQAIVKANAVILTFLVMARQILALRENKRLLAVVDTNLRQLEQYQERLTHQATHDDLTGVANRALCQTHVERLLDAGTRFHLALLDMDDFKAVNDQHGHHTGDALLMTVSGRLAEAIDGMVARLGGDEFVLVLPETDAGELEASLGRVLAILREPRYLNGAPATGAASVGVTTARAGDSAEELLRRADVAMYAAKALGGDRWQWYDPALDEQARETARLNADLLQALGRDEFFLLYQPIVELPSHRPDGVEVLLRWRHPDRGLVSPDVFIPLAERNGLIVELGRWVLENACRQAADWQARFGAGAPTKVSINVSARQLAEPDFVDTVEEVLARTGVDRSRVTLEVTETAVLGAGAPLDAVRRLRGNGLRVALDDFGTGQSSLSLLLNCPVDVLKVDKSFVSGSAADAAGKVIVANLIGFTDGLGLDAVAEGVETPEQARRLFEAGYRRAQGYLFGRPMPAAEIESQLAPVVASSGFPGIGR